MQCCRDDELIDDLVTFRCSACNKTFDYHQIEYKDKFYCSDLCLAETVYTREQFKQIYQDKTNKVSK